MVDLGVLHWSGVTILLRMAHLRLRAAARATTEHPQASSNCRKQPNTSHAHLHPLPGGPKRHWSIATPTYVFAQSATKLFRTSKSPAQRGCWAITPWAFRLSCRFPLCWRRQTWVNCTQPRRGALKAWVAGGTTATPSERRSGLGALRTDAL